MEKPSRNSLKLTETLSQLEGALRDWDQAEQQSLQAVGVIEERRKRAAELLDRLRMQILELSES